MSLRDAFQKAAQTAVRSFGDVGVSTNYHAYATTTYVASTDTNTTTYSTVSGVTVIFKDFALREIDGETVKPEDKMAILPALNIPDVTPGPNDRIMEDVSVTWEVQHVRTDAAGAIHKLHVRRP
jgi:hypothetical protein